MRVLRQGTDWAVPQVRGSVWLTFHKRNLVWGWYIWTNINIWTLCHSLLLEDKATVCLHSAMRTESKREEVSQSLEASGFSMGDLLSFFHP